MNILAVGAHFDDVELGCGGTLARFASEGHNVYVYVATNSGYSNEKQMTVRSSSVALEEGQKAFKIMGAKELICGRFETLKVEFTEELNVEIINIIKEHEIELLFTHWYGDIHHDHQAVSKASLHSARHVPKILMYRSNWYQAPYPFNGSFYVDISDFWSIKEQAVSAHESEINRTGKKWLSFFENEAVNAGQKVGVKYAEVFEPLKWVE